MIPPIILVQVTQLLHEEYSLNPDQAVDAAVLLIKRLSGRGMQVIKGEWAMQESRPALNDVDQETLEREPWKSVELSG